jgi:hypothetical protein
MARERAENGYNSLAGKLLKKTPLEWVKISHLYPGSPFVFLKILWRKISIHFLSLLQWVSYIPIITSYIFSISSLIFVVKYKLRCSCHSICSKCSLTLSSRTVCEYSFQLTALYCLLLFITISMSSFFSSGQVAFHNKLKCTRKTTLTYLNIYARRKERFFKTRLMRQKFRAGQTN